MAGVYTHFAAVQQAMKRVEAEGLLPEAMRQALQEPYTKFLLIGSIAPDYPYLHILSRDSAAWAATLHRWKPLDFIREGIQELTGLPESEQRQKCTAWLLGFASHCVADGVIHPVVDLKVGPYKDNKQAHRRCEMSQDVLVHGKLDLGPIAFNRQLSKAVSTASAPDSKGRELDHDVAAVWLRLLDRVYLYPEHPATTLLDVLYWFSRKILRLFGKPGPERRIPDPHAWHRHMRRIMKKAEISNKILPFGRDVVALLALGYPKQPLPQYIRGLETPLYCPCKIRKLMNFEEIFEKAVTEIIRFWQAMSLACQGQDSPLATMPVWDLNTGTDDRGRFVFWEEK